MRRKGRSGGGSKESVREGKEEVVEERSRSSVIGGSTSVRSRPASSDPAVVDVCHHGDLLVAASCNAGSLRHEARLHDNSWRSPCSVPSGSATDG